MAARGYTAVELIITISVMGILLVLAFVNLSSSQVRARDEERKGDVETMARYIEAYYSNDQDSGRSDGRNAGQYPPITMAVSESTIKASLPDIDLAAVRGPGVSAPAISVVAATNTLSGVGSVSPQPTIAQYVYQPLAWDGTNWVLCEGASWCRKFFIYYRLEADSTVYVIESKNQ